MSVTGSYQVDCSRWPLVVHRVRGTLTDVQVDGYVRAGAEVLARAAPHVTVLDSRELGKVSPYMREHAAAFQREHAEALTRHCLATAYVFSSPLLRFVMMTVKLVTRPAVPYRVFERPEDAEAWAWEVLALAGLARPANEATRTAPQTPPVTSG